MTAGGGRHGDVDLRALEAVPDGVLVCDARGRIVYVNRRTETLTGYARAELIGEPVEMLVPDGLRAAHRRRRTDFQKRPRPRPMGTVQRDYLVQRPDGSTVQVDIALGLLEARGAKSVVASIRDVTQRKALEAELQHRALHDPLTGLANRTLFFDRLRQAMAQGRRERRQVALVMLDLDNFKAVNDAHGHQVGDIVLRRAAASLSKGLRSTDTVARVGGDEFAWILPGISGRQAAAIMMGKLLASVPARYSIDHRWIEVGVSAGMAVFPDDGDNVDMLMRVADVELYAAKRRAPNPRLRLRPA
jgi:diguanylate cyclase (GGDEF)-like protein/PAS domain S-box-containing protein